MALAMVFGGGGVRGAFQAGVWSVLGPKLKPDFVIGSSIGAINAWATTRLTPAELVDWWLTQAPNHLWPRETKPLATLMQAISMRPRRYSWPALAVSTQLPKRQAHVVTLTPENATAWLLASAAMPGWFAPQSIQNRWYVDGGVANDLPVAIARDLGATEILAISALGLGPTPVLGDTPVILPPVGSGAMFDFSLRHRQRLLTAGRKAAQAWWQTPAAAGFHPSSF